MEDLAPEPAESTPTYRELVRRFDSLKNIWRARKKGIRFDPAKGNGIPAASTNIEPVNPDRIKDITGARNADAWMNINVTGKDVLHRFTKNGRKEIVILEDVEAEDVITWRRTERVQGEDAL